MSSTNCYNVMMVKSRTTSFNKLLNYKVLFIVLVQHDKLYAFSYFQVLYRRDAEAQSMSPSHVSSVIFFPAMNANFNKILFCMGIF